MYVSKYHIERKTNQSAINSTTYTINSTTHTINSTTYTTTRNAQASHTTQYTFYVSVTMFYAVSCFL
jgi:phage protein D